MNHFRTLLAMAVFSLATCLSLRAQVFISSAAYENRHCKVTVTVADSLTREPIPFASVYVKLKGDSVITNFSLTDTLGVAELEQVPHGDYTVTAEFMGYKPYVKRKYFNRWEDNLGTFLLQPDPQYITAARVTETAVPVRVMQDTLEFNAAAFHTTDYAVLGDLLKKMPGVEVEKDGSVKVNGKSVTKITVNGKTFFSNDIATAVANLPAKMVDKVQVSDHKEEDASSVQRSDKTDEKQMNVVLKKEYEKGWFGNLSVAGGAAAGDKQRELSGGRDFLYNAKGMVSGYSKESQMTIIGNALNAPGPDDYVGDASGGLMKNHQLGIDANTTSVKGLEISSTASWRMQENDNRSRTERTTILTGADNMLSRTENSSLSHSDKFKVGGEIKNSNRKKRWFNLEPSISYTRSNSDASGSSEATSSGTALNRSVSTSHSFSNGIDGAVLARAGIKDVGKKDRDLRIRIEGNLSHTKGDSRERSETHLLKEGSSQIRSLSYDNLSRKRSLIGTFQWEEPLRKNWIIQTRLKGLYTVRNTHRNAFDMSSGTPVEDDYYSTLSDNYRQLYSLSSLVQYKKDKQTVQIGFEGMTEKNETFSKSFGVSTWSGRNEWLWNYSPVFNWTWQKQKGRLSLGYGGQSGQPSATLMLPVLDVSNPTRLKTGNIYLLPSFQHALNLNWNQYDPKKTLTYFHAGGNASATTRSIVNASWLDKSGVRYAVPVNSRKPGLSANFYGSMMLSLGEKKRLRTFFGTNITYLQTTSYQNTGTVPAIDTEHFDYDAFMSSFWGNPDGDIFYSGGSGFAESLTRTCLASLSGGFSWTNTSESFFIGPTWSSRIQRVSYSLDPSANTTAWQHQAEVVFGLDEMGPFSLFSQLSYVFYSGYGEGYDKPEVRLNAQLSYHIKAWTLFISGNDLLDQQRSFKRTETENYLEDAYTNVLGRTLFLGIKWSFGQAGVQQSRSAAKSSRNM